MSAEPPQDEPGRLVLTPEDFTGYVHQAAQEVAAVHRKRLVLWGFLAGLLSTALIALPVQYLTARSNCHSITGLAHATQRYVAEGKAQTAAFLQTSGDRFGLTAAQFAQQTKRAETREVRNLHAIETVAHRDCTLSP